MSGESWKVSTTASREQIETILEAYEDDAMVLSGREVDEARGEWVLEAWLENEPTAAQLQQLEALFPPATSQLRVERLEAQDWVTLSQADMAPIRAGRFHVRTPDHPPAGDSSLIDLVIPASQAFGTGQHATTAGCLWMLDRMLEAGDQPSCIVDVGTGTGLLAFAAQRLWPGAQVTASDIDPVCETVILENAALNDVAMGRDAGEIAYVTAAGLEHPLLRERAPYDLLIANILAGPLVDLAPEFMPHVTVGGHILLAGLLASQEEAVLAAYRALGCDCVQRHVAGDWSILWLRNVAPSA